MKVNVHRRRWGFTLIELLIVISILSILMALLLPAVQSARESARRSECANNMRNVSTAAFNFETVERRYLGHVEESRVYGKPTSRPWVYALLPYLEQESLYDLHADYFGLGMDVTKDIPRLPTLLCPSNVDGDLSPLHFVLNAGQEDTIIAYGCTWDSAPSSNGVFTHMPEATRQLVNSSLVKDGVSTTLAISESIQARNWQDLSEKYVSFLWFDSFDPDDPALDHMRINGKKDDHEAAPDATWARPSSHHTGVVNVAFLDNHISELNQEMDYVVYAQLMTANGNQVPGDGIAAQVRGYQLNERDY